MRTKETLQLRHQLSTSGLRLSAATYDTKRHHLLTFDSHHLRPHVLRLFSLRRELKSVGLFDKNTEKQLKLKSHIEVVVPSLLLQYSATLDVFICVYSLGMRLKGSMKVAATRTHSVVLLEPATLRKLLVYQGPETHELQCAHYDSMTNRLVLASHLKNEKSNGEGLEEDQGVLSGGLKNVVEILQLSKRSEVYQDAKPPTSTMVLSIEDTHASLGHLDTLTLICGSKGLRQLYGVAAECFNAFDTSSALLQ